MECPMPKPNDLSRSLVALEQDSTLIVVIEMSRSTWLVAGIVPGLERHPLKKLPSDTAALLGLLQGWRDEAVEAGHPIKRIAVAFEAGRDGFWLARWLRDARHRGLRHPSDEHSGVARAPAGEDGSPRHGPAQACLPRLAARRAGSLQHGGDPDAARGGR